MKKISIILTAIVLLVACNNKTKTNEEIIDIDNDELLKPEDLIKNKATADTLADDEFKTDGKEADIYFKDETFNFGTINEGQIVKHTYKFKNNGNADLVISNCEVQCGCTVPDWPKHPIKPGEMGSIEVEFNSAGKAAEHLEKSVTIHSNAKNPQTVISFYAKVLPIEPVNTENQ